MTLRRAIHEHARRAFGEELEEIIAGSETPLSAVSELVRSATPAQRLQNSKLFELVVAIRFGHLLWGDLPREVLEERKARRSKRSGNFLDNGVDTATADMLELAQAKWYAPGSQVAFAKLSTFIAYSEGLLCGRRTGRRIIAYSEGVRIPANVSINRNLELLEISNNEFAEVIIDSYRQARAPLADSEPAANPMRPRQYEAWDAIMREIRNLDRDPRIPILVKAACGFGKTRVLIDVVRHLVTGHVPVVASAESKDARPPPRYYSSDVKDAPQPNYHSSDVKDAPRPEAPKIPAIKHKESEKLARNQKDFVEPLKIPVTKYKEIDKEVVERLARDQKDRTRSAGGAVDVGVKDAPRAADGGDAPPAGGARAPEPPKTPAAKYEETPDRAAETKRNSKLPPSAKGPKIEKKAGTQVLWLVPSVFLMEQTGAAFRQYAPDITIGYIGDGRDASRDKDVAICVYNSVEKVADRDFEMVVIDEAHHAFNEFYRARINPHRLDEMESVENKEAKGYLEKMPRLRSDCFVMMSATFDLPDIKPVFEETFAAGIEAGYLTDYEITVLIFDEGDVKPALAELQKENSASWSAVLPFWDTRSEAKQYRDLLNRSGLTAAYLDGDSSRAERKELLENFARGDYNSLCSASVLREGADLTWVNTVIFGKITRSYSRAMQTFGRALRLHPGKSIAHIVLTCTKIEDVQPLLCLFAKEDPRLVEEFAGRRRGLLNFVSCGAGGRAGAADEEKEIAAAQLIEMRFFDRAGNIINGSLDAQLRARYAREKTRLAEAKATNIREYRKLRASAAGAGLTEDPQTAYRAIGFSWDDYLSRPTPTLGELQALVAGELKALLAEDKEALTEWENRDERDRGFLRRMYGMLAERTEGLPDDPIRIAGSWEKVFAA